MATFVKANISSLVATVVDYSTTVFLVSFFAADAVWASIAGTTLGGIINFLIGRAWVFKSKEGRMREQAVRYAMVWAGNLLLNASGMYLLTHVLKFYYIISKIIVSLLVGVGYNYVLQKKYVFKKPVDLHEA